MVERAQRTIALINHKGGTGKTTSAVNIAAALAELGHPTLLVDTDAQGAVGTSLGISGEKNIFHLLRREAPWTECAVPIRENLDVITADSRLLQLEAELIRQSDGPLSLRRALIDATRYRFLIIDCPPTMNIVAHNVLNFVREILVPVSCDYLSMVSLKLMLKMLDDINHAVNPNLRLGGVIPTFFDMRTRMSQEVVDILRRHFKDHVLPPVRVNTKLREAPSWKKTIFEYAPDSHGAEDYLAVVKRLLQMA